MSLAFRLFKKPLITRDDVNQLFIEIGEFLGEISMGLIDANEFIIIKSFAWERIFEKRGGFCGIEESRFCVFAFRILMYTFSFLCRNPY